MHGNAQQPLRRNAAAPVPPGQPFVLPAHVSAGTHRAGTGTGACTAPAARAAAGYPVGYGRAHVGSAEAGITPTAWCPVTLAVRRLEAQPEQLRPAECERRNRHHALLFRRYVFSSFPDLVLNPC